MEQQIHHIGRIRHGDIPARVIILLWQGPQRTAGHCDQHIDTTPQPALQMQRHAGTASDVMRVGSQCDRSQQPLADSGTERLQRQRISFA